METYFKDFSLKDCHTILEEKLKATGFIVRALAFCPLQNLRFFGDCCNLRIYFKQNGKNKSHCFFAKSISYSAVYQKIILDVNSGFIKECIFYKHLVPDLLYNGIHLMKDCTPKCYIVSGMKYLIFDDLSTQNYQIIETRISMNFDYLKVSLDAIAKLHCCGFILEEKMREKTGRYRLCDKYPTLLRESLFPYSTSSFKAINAVKMAARAVIDLMAKESSLNIELFKQLTDEAFDNFPEYVKPSNTFRNTICHGDLWSPNLLYKFERNIPVHCYIVDYQLQRYSPPAQDVMSFIYLVTDQQFRQQHMNLLINYYYGRVSAILKDYTLSVEDILPYGEYIDSCNYYKIFGNCLAINHHYFGFVPLEYSEYLHQNASKIIFSDRTQHVLKFCAEDELYRRKSFENICDLKQAFIEKGLL